MSMERLSGDRDEKAPAETDERFPSGAWVGFWMQRPHAGRQWMRDLYLHFLEGNVSGFGSDWVGEFVMKGKYELATGKVTLWKRYVGAHDVAYEGRNENDGKWVWGVWEMRGFLGGAERGGFHMWPKGEEDPTVQRLRAEEEVPAEGEVAVLIGEGIWPPIYTDGHR